MGSAERNWGDVKYLKSEKRSHLSAEAVEKQATIFGASCMMDADIERKKVQSNTEERINSGKMMILIMSLTSCVQLSTKSPINVL